MSRDDLLAFTKANKSEQVYATKLGDMEKLLETLQAGLHRSKASQTVASLEASDRERDDALSTLTGLVKVFSRVKEASSKEAYDKLSKFFKNYAWLMSMSYEKETEAINLQSTPMLIQIKSSMLISVSISTLSVVAIKKRKLIKKITPTQPEEAK